MSGAPDIARLVDGEARRSIREELDRTLVVEAAAGTGKTTELVQRVVAMVASGRAQLSSIVAVTFTEKAAGEMKLRIRTELDRALLHSRAQDDAAQAHLRQALAELEAARVGTIHAFCADLLREYPIEARVDPAFEVADAMLERMLIERAFDGWLEHALQDPGEGVRRVLARGGYDERAKGAREQLLDAAGRLIRTRDFPTPYRRDPFDRRAALHAMREQLTNLAALAARASARNDPLAVSLRELGERLARARHVNDDELEAFLRALLRERDKVWNHKRGQGRAFARDLTRADVLEQKARARQDLEACVRALDADVAACLSRELAPIVQAYAAEKRAHGTLDFFDLLLLTRALLCEHDAVRNRVQRDISHLFVDEFQDTDPVQSELLLLIGADDPAEREPWRVRPIPGKLFVVGDPKQSIYRFRRADVALYERIKRHLVALGASVLELSTSFRSLPAIQSLVNAAFAPLMNGDVSKGEANYVPLSPFRAPRTEQPAIVALPAPSPYGRTGRLTKKAINGSLPDAVGAWIDWLVHKSGYVVQEAGRDVPVEPRHVCLLFRRFKDWNGDVTREYVRALEARRVPHVLSGGRSFHVREEVIALRAVLTALEWPDDTLHIYATLRGPFVALHDQTLLSFKRKTRHLHPLRSVDDALLDDDERQVAAVLALLARLHRQRNRVPIAETLTTLFAELRMHAGVAIWPTGEQALGNVLRILDYARSYERPGRASSFRGFVEWLAQHAELADAADAPVIEESSDGVRIMTIHAAKGLEFPVVVLCDPTMQTRPEYPQRFIDPERQLWAQALCDSEPVELAEQRELMRDHESAEVTRVAYVAVTRAKELLVVPTSGDGRIEGWVDLLGPAVYPLDDQRRAPRPSHGVPTFTADSLVARPMDLPTGPEVSVAPGLHRPIAGDHDVVWWDPNVLGLQRAASGGVTQRELLTADAGGGLSARGLAEYEAFRAQRDALRESAAQPSLRATAITQLAAAQAELPLEAEPADATLPVEVIDSGAQRIGRPSGTRFGVLVHALFEHALLDERELELAAIARHVAREIGATAEEQARALADVQLALGHPLFTRIRAAHARGELYREAPVTVCVEASELREGAVDLAFREDARLVVVDFKTDVQLGDLRAYRTQLGLYADALQRALGEPVECILFRV